MRHLLKRRDFFYMVSAALLGSAFHFFYDFTGQNALAALISPVNESTWEHLKLLFFPVLLLTIVEFWIRRPNPAGFFGARLFGVLAGMILIIVLFYMYSFLLGKNFLIIDILIFLISVCFTYVLSGHLYKYFRHADGMLIFLGWMLMILLFFSFTCFPPDFFLFYLP